MLDTAYGTYMRKEKTNFETTVMTVLNTYKLLPCICVTDKQEHASVPKGLMITKSPRQRVTRDWVNNEEVIQSPDFHGNPQTTY